MSPEPFAVKIASQSSWRRGSFLGCSEAQHLGSPACSRAAIRSAYCFHRECLCCWPANIANIELSGQRTIGHVVQMGFQLVLQNAGNDLAVPLVHLDELVRSSTLIAEWPCCPADLKIEANGQPFMARTTQFHSVPNVIHSHVPVVTISPRPGKHVGAVISLGIMSGNACSEGRNATVNTLATRAAMQLGSWA